MGGTGGPRGGVGGASLASGGSAGSSVKPGSGGNLGSGGVTNSGGAAGSARGGNPGSGGRPPQDQSGGATVTVTGGTMGMPGSCSSPPALEALVGWASVNSKGVNGTTGADATAFAPIVVTTVAAFKSNAAGTDPRVINVTGTLTGKFTIGSNKTIAGLCGAELHGTVEMKGSVNVILRNIKIVGYGAGNCALDPAYDASVGCSSGNDAVSVLGGHHIWIDHCDISDGTDGNLDITKGADFVTVSWTKFHYSSRTDNSGSDSTGASGHRFSNLVGGADNSSIDVNALNITWHHDWWADGVMERQPRVRYGKNHIFNNLWASTGDNYCVRAGMQASLLLENNYFSGVGRPQEFNSTADQGTAFITATNNVYESTTGTMATGGGGTAFSSPPYPYHLDDPAGLKAAIMAAAGPR